MKTVSLDDEAYELLRGAKTTRTDSFSSVVKRHFEGNNRKDDLEASFGSWKISESEAAQLRKGIRDGFQRPDWE